MLTVTLLLWWLVPRIPQDPAYHAFADTRALYGLPNAANVLSNITLVIVGLIGIAWLASATRVRLSQAAQASLWCAMVGLVGTALGSAWYHLVPDDARLVWDRLPMTLIFSGVMGAALAQRIGQHAARVALALLTALGAISIVYWHSSGDLSLYVTLQYGGVAALVALLLVTRGRDDPFPWWWILGWYALTKLFEIGDGALWRATGGLVAGHALKHVAAAIASAGLLRPLARSQEVRQL